MRHMLLIILTKDNAFGEEEHGSQDQEWCQKGQGLVIVMVLVKMCGLMESGVWRVGLGVLGTGVGIETGLGWLGGRLGKTWYVGGPGG